MNVEVKYIGNNSSPLSFMKDKKYVAVAITKDAKFLRIIDETGEAYLYSPQYFKVVKGDISKLFIE